MKRHPIAKQTAHRAVYAVSAIAVAGVVTRQGGADTRYGLVALLALAFCIADLIPLTLPRGGEFTLSGGVATVAATMLNPFVGVGALFVGACSAAAVRDFPPSPAEFVVDTVRRVTALLGAFWVYGVVSNLGGSLIRGYPVIAVLAAGLAYMQMDVFSYALIDSRGGRGVLRAGTSLLDLVAGVYLSQVFVGTATTIVYSSLQAVGFVILFVLMLLLQSSFSLLLRVRAAYTRTLSAVARLAECEAGGTPGHSERVAEIATSIARIRHMSGQDAKVLSYAALLHNIGNVHGCAPHQQTDGSRSLEELFDDIPYLTGVGAVVSASLNPFPLNDCGEGQAAVLGGVLHVACAYDDFAAGKGMPPLEIVEALAGSEYDQASVRALATAITRQEV